MPSTLDMMLAKGRLNVVKLLVRMLPAAKPDMHIGPGAAIKLCQTISDFGLKNVLVVTDAMLVELGLVSPVVEALEKAGLQVTLFDGVEPDPNFAVVENGLASINKATCDCVMAVGGGSSIDTAKVIAAALSNDKTPQQLVGIMKLRKAPLPIFAVPTTAGTGSEVTQGAVISQSDSHQKDLIIDPKLVPVAAALDPKLMTGLPKAITAATGVDALTHALEAFVGNFKTEESDRYAKAAMKLIFEHLPKVFKNGRSLKSREAMAVASYYAGLAVGRAGIGYVHALAHQIGARYQLPHGDANGLFLPHVLAFSRPNIDDKLADIAIMLELGSGREEAAILADRFMDYLRNFLGGLGIANTLDRLPKEDFPDIIAAAFKEAHGTYPVPAYMTEEQCGQLLNMVLPGNRLNTKTAP